MWCLMYYGSVMLYLFHFYACFRLGISMYTIPQKVAMECLQATHARSLMLHLLTKNDVPGRSRLRMPLYCPHGHIMFPVAIHCILSLLLSPPSLLHCLLTKICTAPTLGPLLILLTSGTSHSPVPLLSIFLPTAQPCHTCRSSGQALCPAPMDGRARGNSCRMGGGGLQDTRETLQGTNL